MTLSTTHRIGLALAGFAMVAAVWWWQRPPEGFLTGMVPLEGDRAIFTMRHNPDNGAAQAWVGLLGADGEVVWSQELPALTYSVYAGHGITVSEDLITIKVSDQSTFAQLIAFDIETGEPRWESPRIEFPGSEGRWMMPIVAGEQPYTDGKQLIHGDADGEGALLVARDAADGARLWEHDVDAGMREVVFSANALAYRADLAWTFLSRSTGEVVRKINAYAAGCSDAERFVTWGDDQLITVDWSSADLAVTTTPLTSEGIPLYCGLRAGTPVFTVAHREDESGERSFELVAVDPNAASVQWRIGLGQWEPSSIARSRDNDTPEAHPLRGSLTDFVPVLLGKQGSDGVKLAVLDMAKHEIAWEGTPHAELLQFDVFRGDESQYFLVDFGRVAALDGHTGKLTAAIKLGHADARAFHVSQGHLWLFSTSYGRMGTLPWTRLDGTTLEPSATGHADFRPSVITDEFVDWIGG